MTIQEYALPNMTTCSSDFMERPNKEFKLLQTNIELISTPRQSPPINITKIFLATTNLHFMQHEFCSRVYLFSITGEFTFRKECIAAVDSVVC